MLDINSETQVQSFMRMARMKMIEPNEEEIRVKQEAGILHVPRIYARFYVGSVKEADWSESNPKYRDQVMVFIQAFGERDSITAIADETHIEKYPREYELFQRNYDKHPVTLKALPKATPSVLAAFEDLKINSIDELLAAKTLPEHLQPYREWAQQIKAIHDAANGVEIKRKRGRPPKVA
jgi:hypothetical protein